MHKYALTRGSGGMLPQEKFDINFTISEAVSGGFLSHIHKIKFLAIFREGEVSLSLGVGESYGSTPPR